MTLYLSIPALVGVIGAGLYLATSSGKSTEIGRLMFFTGLLVTLLHLQR